MTQDRVTEERLREMLAEFTALRDNLRQPDDHGAVSAFYTSLSIGEVVSLVETALRSEASRAPEGWVVVPKEPTEDQWGGLARAIVMWWGMDSQPTGEKLYQHLQLTGEDIPDWLTTEIPDQAHVPPKGTVAACIYRAMIAAAPLPPDSGE